MRENDIYCMVCLCKFLHVEHKLKIYEIHEKEKKKINCFRSLITSCLYPEILWLSYLLSSLSSLLSWFSFMVRCLLLGARLGAPPAVAASTGASRGRARSCGALTPSISRAALATSAGAVRLLCLLGAAQATSGEGRR